MLKLNATICNGMFRRAFQAQRLQGKRLSSSSAAINEDPISTSNTSATQKESSPQNANTEQTETEHCANDEKPSINYLSVDCFDSLKENIKGSIAVTPLVTSKIDSAQSLVELIELIKLPGVSKPDIVKMMSLISESVSNAESVIKHKNHNVVVPGIVTSTTEEAGNQKVNLNSTIGTQHVSKEFFEFSHLSTPGILQVFYDLAKQRQRNKPLLSYLAQNIVQYNDQLQIKQCSSLLRSMAMLTFPNQALLNKIVQSIFNSNVPMSSSTLFSITTSLGMLRYKNTPLLDWLCVKCMSIDDDKSRNVQNMIKTCAALDFKSRTAMDFIQGSRSEIESTLSLTSMEGFYYVWALVLLNQAAHYHYEAILSNKHMSEIYAYKKNPITVMQILNINAAAQYQIDNYSGPLLDTTSLFSEKQLASSKKKVLFTSALQDTLGRMLPSVHHFATNVDSGMGFSIDGVCYLDSSFTPVTAAVADESEEDYMRVAILIQHYSDFCHGEKNPVGMYSFQKRLLKGKGYDIVELPYTHFSPQDTVLKRIKCIKEHIQTLRPS